MRFVHYSLSYRYSKICSFVNKYAFRDFIDRFTFVQLSYTHLTPLWCLFFIAQYHNFWLQHHEVVYILLPQGVYEGPALIFYTALRRTHVLPIRDTPQHHYCQTDVMCIPFLFIVLFVLSVTVMGNELLSSVLYPNVVQVHFVICQ